ncbi:MAG: DUF4922 domain-containing protein [Pseudomonadota bacterium]
MAAQRERAPGKLWPRVLDASAQGLACGALLPIDTRGEELVEGPLHFAVRVVSNLARKDGAREAERRLQAAGQRDVNPFLPHDPALWVADLSPTHHVLLNKFFVVPHHLLLVTRAFAPQEQWLDTGDFEALSLVLAQIDGLAFYNGGAEAGASQPHKHVQVVPLPLGPGGPRFPLARWLEVGSGVTPQTSELFPFAHSIGALDPMLLRNPRLAAARMCERYHELIQVVGMGPARAGQVQSCPYNLLVTRTHMVLVPRRQEKVAGISINALGYAGALLVRNDEQLCWLREHGPLSALVSAGQARP